MLVGGGVIIIIAYLWCTIHLLRAQSAYKDISHKDTLISSHTHAHATNTYITGDGLVKRQINMVRRDRVSVLTEKKRAKTNA